MSAPLLVSAKTAGLSPRHFRAIVRKHGLPTVQIGRRKYVRADTLLRALGLADVVAPAAPTPVWTDAGMRAALLRGARARREATAGNVVSLATTRTSRSTRPG